ncbi:hypothetical protein LD112_11495 [Pantoea agglomerans]|nr:hypothetical protein [Pantoea agglomerans]
MKPLSLRTLPREEASLRQRIGHGLGYPFTLAGEAGELQLRLAPPASGHRRRASHARREGYLWRRAKRC